MEDLGNSAATVSVSFGRAAGSAFGIDTDAIADAISPGASCTVTHEGAQARVSQALGTTAAFIVPGPRGANAAARSSTTRIADDAAENFPNAICKVNSFDADTPVLMADGTRKQIKDVKLGDLVQAADPETGQRGARKVIDLIQHTGQHAMVAIHLTDGTTIDATDHHPFWVTNRSTKTRGTWVNAIDLDAGDRLQGGDGSTETIRSVDVSVQALSAYNLTVADLHTYYAGERSVLVHNCLSPNQMNKAILTGKAPRGIKRVDTGKIPGEQTHVHFEDGSALNIDGTWKHGGTAITNKQSAWLRKNGWTVPNGN